MCQLVFWLRQPCGSLSPRIVIEAGRPAVSDHDPKACIGNGGENQSWHHN
jgi:hypothetical protein